MSINFKFKVGDFVTRTHGPNYGVKVYCVIKNHKHGHRISLKDVSDPNYYTTNPKLKKSRKYRIARPEELSLALSRRLNPQIQNEICSDCLDVAYGCEGLCCYCECHVYVVESDGHYNIGAA